MSSEFGMGWLRNLGRRTILEATRYHKDWWLQSKVPFSHADKHFDTHLAPCDHQSWMQADLEMRFGLGCLAVAVH